MIMTTSEMREKIAELPANVLTPDVATAIEWFGKYLKEAYYERLDAEKVYLDTDARAARRGQPMVAVEEPDIAILVNGHRISLTRADPNKPAISIPFGQSDRVTQAAIPRDWLSQSLYQFLINVDDGNTEYAEACADWLNQWIDIAMVETDGSVKIDKEKLPVPAAAVFTTELVDSHKRKTKSKAKGSTSFNLAMSVEVDDTTPNRLPNRTVGFTPPLEIPNPPPMPSPTSVSEASQLIDKQTGGAVGAVGGGDDIPVPVRADPTLSTNALLVSDEWKAEGLLLDIIEQNPLTKGAIRKAIDDRVPEPMWTAELDRMVKDGIVTSTTNGGPRSTRYTRGVVA